MFRRQVVSPQPPADYVFHIDFFSFHVMAAFFCIADFS